MRVIWSVTCEPAFQAMPLQDAGAERVDVRARPVVMPARLQRTRDRVFRGSAERSAASELAPGRSPPAAARAASASASPSGVLDERHEPGLREAAAELELVVVDRLAERLPPRDDDRALAVRERDHHRADAGVRDDDARATDRLDHLLEGEEVDELGAGALDRRRVAVLDDELLVERKLRDRAQQPVEAGLVRADADEDHAPAEKTLPAKRAPRQRLGELGPLHVAPRCDRRDQPVGERRALDPREALDVDDRRAAQPRDPGERHGDAGAGREHDLRPHLADDAPGDERGCGAGS